MQSKYYHCTLAHPQEKCTLSLQTFPKQYSDQPTNISLSLSHDTYHCSNIRTMCTTRSKPSRRRTRTRKPKFASLRDRLAPALPPQPPGMVKNQPELFQVQPDSDPQVACLLEQEDAVDASATISALFGPASSSSAVFDEAPSPVSSSMDWDGEGLARRALRGRERWVFCRSASAEEAVSSGGSRIDLWGGAPSQGLSLKLDYQEILTAWSDKGSLYIDGEGPQVVPELQQICVDDYTAPSLFIELGSNGSNWRVPEMDVDQQDGDQRRNAEKRSSRKDRVMRYKEKRQSRLFAKRIRYEVRKLNAEKRPRIKGRFVKRNDDM